MGVARSVRSSSTTALIAVLSFVSSVQAVADDGEETITEIIVSGTRVANTVPAGTYASPVTALRFDPLTELQSRGLPEGQADVTVRGGLFENTGFKAGAVTLIDPQTGHYAAELPIDPAWLTSPRILTGIDNTVAGFNSNVATVSYAFRDVASGGALLLGAGSDALTFQGLRVGSAMTSAAGADWGVALSLARSAGDGTVPFGDHEFERYNLHLQRSNESGQTDLLLGYQDKFYGWPGAYTGFASLPETDRTRTTLLLANHLAGIRGGTLQAAVFYRRLADDYDFDRTTSESGAPGSFDHETRVYGMGFSVDVARGALAWNVAGQVTADELVSSTDLTAGGFDSRNYGSLSIVPAVDIAGSAAGRLQFRFGARADWSNRDGSAVSPVLGLTWRTATAAGSRTLAIEYAGASQLPGYTALNSRPTGLFGGNPDLGREKAQQLSATAAVERAGTYGSLTLFYRRDDDLVDWTFASGAPFARQANAVDLDVFGIELLAGRQWDALRLIASYSWLDKDADYGSAVVDASFYALNFARQRVTLAVLYRFTERFELRLDNEYRVQESNPLRGSSDKRYFGSIALLWGGPDATGFGASFGVDNVTDDDFEQFPGTPAVGRQLSLSVHYGW
jgi:vitamin B12 transporter